MAEVKSVVISAVDFNTLAFSPGVEARVAGNRINMLPKQVSLASLVSSPDFVPLLASKCIFQKCNS